MSGIHSKYKNGGKRPSQSRMYARIYRLRVHLPTEVPPEARGPKGHIRRTESIAVAPHQPWQRVSAEQSGQTGRAVANRLPLNAISDWRTI